MFLEELLKLNEDLQEFIYQASTAMNENLFISFRSTLSMFCLTLRYYKEISPMANTITEFLNLINTNKDETINMNSLKLELSGESVDMESNLDDIFDF